MPDLITPGLHISIQDILAKKSKLEADIFSQKIINLIHLWYSDKPITMFTSGSTGTPKEIILDRPAMKASVHSSAVAFGLQKGDIFLCCLSTDHIAGMMMVIRALVLEADIIAIPPTSYPLMEIPGNRKIDFAALVPLQLQNSISDEYLPELNKMKAIIVGGAPVSAPLSGLSQKIQSPVYQTYGMTETYTHVALKRLNGIAGSDKYIGMEGISFSIDERECLVIHAPPLDIDSLVTNDVVELDGAKQFRWIGRYDNVINSGGLKIHLEKIEHAVEAGLAELGLTNIALFATSKKDAMLGDKLILIIEGKEWRPAFSRELMLMISSKLSRYEIPKEFVFIAEFKRTTLGKIDRQGTIKTLNFSND